MCGLNNYRDKSYRDASVREQYPDVRTKCPDFKFPGRGQRMTPVAALATMVEIIMLLPGSTAASHVSEQLTNFQIRISYCVKTLEKNKLCRALHPSLSSVAVICIIARQKE